MRLIFIARQHTDARIDIANLSVCLSVRPSVGYVAVPDENGFTYRHSFLSHVSTLTRDIDIANLSVCLSVRLSVCPSVRNVPVSDENGLTSRHSFFTIR